ncbi:zinc ribbon domain-containing protein [Desulfurivibrio dismutans]|uniref:zinc ribbon domain-containing protein n=1 Tax=Desulfurivibrio dismutans TaxID=1398908 RepID=UPI0023DB2F6C|nr:zinc ribbon domain-containing protein [Desulfurivibrio alkaliphilus]MDF1614771.1 zinc ribbon domain-containing protein [Desulfurivibrio alkaliphilus]
MIEDRTERCLRLAQEEHYCPHCRQQLSCCQAPPFHVGDGLGWGSDILFICLNDECSLYVKSWQEFEDRYGHAASCRYILCPGNEKGEAMMVGGQQAFKGLEVNIEALQQQNQRHAREKEAAAKLDGCVEAGDLAPVIYLLTDEHADLAIRKQACELLAQFQDLSCLDPLRNHKFRNPELEQEVNLAIGTMLKAMYKKECPNCAEIIKSQAPTCKHCGYRY